ncbi:alpha/beta hydrolase [Serpentinicella sp. ANB-PHB4]|uniref:alpha/beta fold hydrolase n=1 Tax=Serpentinicella sp. ANB-PHB4 TaxID=3074076 RepID=UPI00285E72E5|nr:alpha/beta hydrolase [Serpentinicella sp. ANB-PHB4]MDR5659234.1 alpha/beta hydrolase [Serpentinicella sp. ANB-PHB4]
MPYFTVNDINLYYEIKGNPDAEETIILFNGIMSGIGTWTPILDALEKLNCKIILHDFKGQLLSDKPEGPYTLAEHASEAKALLDFLNIKEFHAVSTSYGGAVAMRFATDYPESVKTITIINSLSEADEIIKLHIKSWRSLALTKNAHDFFWSCAPAVYSNTFLEKYKKGIEQKIKEMENIPDDFYFGQLQLYKTFNNGVGLTPQLSNIKCPALVVCGENDVITSLKFSKIIANNLPQSEFVVIPDCGHAAILEKADTITTLLFGFLTKHFVK